MKFLLGLTAAGALLMAAHVDRPGAQVTQQIAQLSEPDMAVVVQAAVEAKSHQKTPKDFTPAVGASIPRSLFIHGFKPEIAVKVPELKHYWYAYLDREIVLIDAIQTKVVAVIPLPEMPASVGQGHHGAAEPAGQSTSPEGSDSTDSVPAYTSPETIK
jgi:hypothetical protein